MSEDTRIKLSLPELVEPPMKPYMNPFPPKGRIYDYKFVKEVCNRSFVFGLEVC